MNCTDRRCDYPGCKRKHWSRGLCRAHDHQRSRGGPLRPIGQRPSKPMPATWEQPDTTRARTNGVGAKLREVGLSRALTADEVALTRRLCARMGALDLAEMLGVTP